MAFSESDPLECRQEAHDRDFAEETRCLEQEHGDNTERVRIDTLAQNSRKISIPRSRLFALKLFGSSLIQPRLILLQQVLNRHADLRSPANTLPVTFFCTRSWAS